MSSVYTFLKTVSFLKPIQAFYQVKYKLAPKKPLSAYKLDLIETYPLSFFQIPFQKRILEIQDRKFSFSFLNLASTYEDQIDWDDQGHAKLWNYNLQYLDFLKQEDLEVAIKAKLLQDVYSWLWDGRLPLEPYPASLRIMNVIRFLETNQIPEANKAEIQTCLLAELNYLSQNLEYHLLANHLLENAFALWMGALYFNDAGLKKIGEKLLKEELEKQILSDGAHFELAPMYHQIILFRVLESFHLTSEQLPVRILLKEKAELMLGWLEQMTFEDGSLPHFNDTTEGIAQSANELLSIGDLLGIRAKKVKLKESGYQIFQVQNLKLVADVEGIKPSYQPGHAHADTFSFVLHEGEIPVIVDPGLSTYNISQRRDWERSTKAHNTLTINGKNSSEVWAGFRVGRRAKVEIRKDTEFQVEGVHDGFFPALHSRTFQIENSGISLIDEVSGDISPESQKVIRFYLHPTIQPELIETNSVRLTSSLHIQFSGADSIEFSSYDFCRGFNLLEKALVMEVRLKEKSIKSLFINK